MNTEQRAAVNTQIDLNMKHDFYQIVLTLFIPISNVVNDTALVSIATG